MPITKPLDDIVQLIAELDDKYQERAMKALLPILEEAEEDFADSHLSRLERRAVREERRMMNFERRFGKAAADEMRARVAAIKRGGLDGL